MHSHRTLRRAAVVSLLLVIFLLQETWTLAGVTGGLAGTVKDSNGAPIAGAIVQAVSPSQAATATTDERGHFVFLSLAPDTYTLNLSKEGYQSASVPGAVVFADQTQQYALVLSKVLKTIGHVTAGAGNTSLVKSGIGGDLYQVNSSQIAASTAVGGGGSLNSIYSAIATQPGLVVGTGGAGWNQAVVIHGQNPWFTGFEYDGIPVNRAFDNYTSSTGSNLGLQQLEIYTGGGPSSISSSGVSGFINQVIKTGTYPGYVNLNGGIATGAFYHQASVEAGGATPDRDFSYYVGISGYDQAFRYFDPTDGAGIMGFNSPYSGYSIYGDEPALTGNTGQGVLGACTTADIANTKAPFGYLGYSSYLRGPSPLSAGCLIPYSGLYGSQSYVTDRENVANMHLAIPRKNGLRDDIQLLWSGSAMKSYFTSSPDAGGPSAPERELAQSGIFLSAPGATPNYSDAIVYNLPFGTNIAPGGSGSSTIPATTYYQPNSPAHSFDGTMPGNLSDLYNNDTGIVKFQFTHPLSENSYLRFYAYTFFSDWTEDGPNSGSTSEYPYSNVAPDYDLITHTSGGSLAYANQINDQNLVQFTTNFTEANVSRFNNTGFLSGSSPIGYISEKNGVYTCWDPNYTTNPSPSDNQNGSVPCYSSTYQGTAAGGPSAFNGSSAARAAGAYWSTLWNYDASGTYNTVKPQFWSGSLSDQLRPSDKFMFGVAMRYDNFTYGIPSGYSQPQNAFYAQIINQYACYDYTTQTALTNPLSPGVPPPATLALQQSCPAGYVHPGSTKDPFTLNNPSSYTQFYYEPQVSGTYTQSPDTVWRFSAGRYAQPPIAASVDYLYAGGSAVNLWGNFMNAGFLSPFHPIAGMTSGQYNLSLERHLRGTPLTIKITPFYSATSNWQQQSFIGAGFVTQIPVGRARNYGAELAVTDGDFSRNGFSGSLALTYTQAQVQFQDLLGQSQISYINEAIGNYNQLTKQGGGAPCYTPATSSSFGKPASCSNASAIKNPYYNQQEQGYLNPNGWYPQGIDSLATGGVNNDPGFYSSPWVATLMLNYRKDKLAITPSLQFQSGVPYGTPLDVTGLDPRTCEKNQLASGIPNANGQYCDYRTSLSASASTESLYPSIGDLYIPNPQTGSYAGLGAYTEPNIILANLQATYDVSPRIRLQATAASLWHTCFGGSKEPWTSAYPANSTNCGYYPTYPYVSNFYNGSGPEDTKANGISALSWTTQSYNPKANNGQGGYYPFNLYLNAQIRL